MSKDKKLRKIVIDKLYHKNQNCLKQSTRSNAPTQSTPNQAKNFSKFIQNFFQNFQAQCAIIYQPVIRPQRRELKRSLQNQLNYLFKYDGKSILKTQEYQRIKYSTRYKTLSEEMFNEIKVSKISGVKNQQMNNQQKYRQNRQNKIINTDAGKQNLYKSKSMIFCTRLQNSSQLKQKKEMRQFKQFKENQQRDFISIIRNLKSKKQPLIVPKQQNIYQTNSKYVPSKYMPRNAPVKELDKPLKYDRMKRIQSLKNFNENGFRRYSYKRDL